MGKVRKFEQLDYETGEVIKKYDTIKDALIEHQIHRATLNHAMINKGGRLPDRKLLFRYGDGINKPIHRYKVGKLNEAGEVVKVYNSVEQAAIENYVSEKTISVAITRRNGLVPSLGIRFKYILK